jgi:hypothetical protein
MKSIPHIALSCSLAVLSGLIPACSGDASLGDNHGSQSADQDVHHGGSAGAASSASAGAATTCAAAECIRAIECVASCGGPVLKSGCCPCDAGTFDRALECGASTGGSGGGGSGGGSSTAGTSNAAAGTPADSGGSSAQAGAAPTAPGTDGLNAACGADAGCAAGLTPVHFYGVAGMSGPEFCWCTIPCADNPDVCPDGTACTNLSDGPGTVCFAP